MSIETKKEILLQKNQVFDQEFQVDLADSCRVGDGIVQLSTLEKDLLISVFDRSCFNISFFIPASGTGSRMFRFLFEWQEKGVESKEVDLFFDNLKELPFYKSLIENGLIKKNGEFVKLDVARFVLKENAIPAKGLIPFHENESITTTAFQDHVFQAQAMFGNEVKIHFTIQKEYESLINSNISSRHSDLSKINFSYQQEETNAFCFNDHGETIKIGEDFLKRPAGHGAILNNLNEIDSDIVLIKNIDNIQHNSKSQETDKTWKVAISFLVSFKNELLALSKDFLLVKLRELNDKYQFISPDLIGEMSIDSIQQFLKRPSRVAGMVKNEGEPGGGPFWIKGENGVTNQIIEKSQIKNQSDQEQIVRDSSHFNPVFIALSKTDAFGNKLNLLDFRDDSKFFVVKKSHQGKEIFYRELPGLWNGGMSNWNTIFLEIPSSVFSPVKSV